jgi:hypothetical protein
MQTENIVSATSEPAHFINPGVLRLDGQQIKAQKYEFPYEEPIENQRRFIALFVDYLLIKEKETLEKNGNDIEQIRFPEELSDIDICVGFFIKSLSKIEDIEVLVKDNSFNEHLNSLNCFNWDFYFKTLLFHAHKNTSKAPKIDGEWKVMRHRTSLETLDDLQPVSQIVFKDDENQRCDLWNYFQQERLKEPE